MKRLILLFPLIVLCMQAGAQDKDSTLNILKAPISPAANLLGISPSDVQRPSDPSAFMVSVQSAANNSSGLPASYAVDLAPAWLLAGHKITYRDFVDSTSGWKSIKQSFILSAAITSQNDSNGKDATLAFGVKFSILRGAVDRKALDVVNQSQWVLNDVNTVVNAAVTAVTMSTAFRNATGDMKALMIDTARTNARGRVTVLSDSLKSLAKSIDFTRHGLKLDIAGGASINYPGQRFDYGLVNKAGVWITGGYESERGFAVLGIVRYLYNPDKIFADEQNVLHRANLSTFDAGARLLYDNHDRFTLSGEAIYRSVLQKTEVKPTYRFTINADYKIKANQLLTLAIGRDYDGTFNKDGNVIAALNLLLGFGNNRGRPTVQ